MKKTDKRADVASKLQINVGKLNRMAQDWKSTVSNCLMAPWHAGFL